jgi:hypothetical protein
MEGFVATPQEIIERIRRQEYLIGVELPPDVEEGARNMRLNLNNALKTLSEDLYSKETHFVLELVQNADDNEYAAGLDPELSFHLTAGRLIVQNNEVGFTEANVAALCKIGQSTKTKRAGFIGEKGIGFKSVFTVTDHPEIHSNGFHFRFDRSDPKHVLGYVVPNWCGDAGYHRERTTIILPAKEGSHFTDEKLLELTDELLLFLGKLRTIIIADDTFKTKRIYKRKDDSGIVSLTSETFAAESDLLNTSQRKFRYVRHTYPTTNIKEEKRQDAKEATVVLAFPIMDDGVASADFTQNLFAFLPVRNYGFRFLVQGDFLLSSNREDVHKGLAWNKRVRDEIPKAFVKALSVFKADPALSKSFLQYVPRKEDITDVFFAEAADEIVEELKGTECMLSASGAWMTPREVIMADDEFKALFPNEDLKRILGLEYLSREVDAPKATLERLGVLNANTYSHLFALIGNDDGLAERPINWLRALYRYCEKKVTSEQAIKKFRSLEAIKLDGGGLVQLAVTEVYFPLQRDRKFGFEEELALLHPKLMFNGDGADEVASFLSRVGVKKTEPYSLIVHHILPRHTSETWKESSFPALVGHVAYIKEHLSEYLKDAAAAGESTDKALTKLRTGLYLQSKKVEDGETYFARAFNMYLGTDYRPAVPLEQLLGVNAHPIKFIAGVYLSPAAKAIGDDEEQEDRKTWREFFYKIGVNACPVVDHVVESGIDDYRASPELTSLLSSEDPKIRKQAVEILDHNWVYYSRFLQTRSTSRRGTATSTSQLLQLLRGVRAPSRKFGEFKLGDTYQDVDYVRAVFGDSAVYLDAEVANADFLDAVGVTHRVDAAACIKRLDQLRGTERVSNKAVKTIYRELERLFDKEKTLISNAFAQAPRIYVPANGRWCTCDEVVWESTGAFMDGQCPPLEVAYREHQTFFCRHLRIPRLPNESTLIQALARLETYGKTHADRKGEALKIYRRLARSYRDERTRDPNSEPSWLDSLRTEAVFLDHIDRLVDVSNDIYIGDDPRLADAFKAHERISLLDVELWQVPQLLELLSKCGMQKLSQVANYVLTTVCGETLDAEVTRRIRQRSRHLMRVVYARAHGAFEQANRQGRWKSLGSLEVRTVTVLEVQAEISGYSVRVPTDTYRNGDIIYLQTGTRGKYDKLADELCLYLCVKPDELSEGVYRVLTAPGEDELQDFFEVKGIPVIPNDELMNLLESEQQSRSDELEQQQTHRTDAPDGAQEDVGLGEVARTSAGESMAQARPGTSIDGPAMQPQARPADHLPTAGTSGSETSKGMSSSPPTPRRREPERKASGRLLSYAEPASHSEPEMEKDSSHEARLSTAKVAVDFVLKLEREGGRQVVEMPFTNEGFDIRRGPEGAEEYIEVKGLTGAWGAEGIVLTPPELRMAERQRERFWLYVVEYATEPSQRHLYKIQDPYGKTNQFRFDFGWKRVATGAVETMDPAQGRRVSIESLGAGMILSVTEAGALRRLSIRLDSGEEITRVYDPTKMIISELE